MKYSAETILKSVHRFLDFDNKHQQVILVFCNST